MANFCSYPQLERITEVGMPNSLDPKASSITIGLNGYKDFEGKPLEILTTPYLSVRKGNVVGDVQLYELSSSHSGRWVLQARTQSGSVWDVLTVNVAERDSFYAGFDRLVYPGDSIMRTMFEQTNLYWCGFYLAPAPSHPDTSWMTKLDTLQQIGWGVAPTYVGQQMVGPGSKNVTAAQGTLDARDAAKLASAAGLSTGSILFLDIEQGPPIGAAALAYYSAWASELEDHTNYSPGVYCSFYQVAQSLHDVNSTPIFWIFNVNKFTCGPAKGGRQTISPSSPFPAPDPVLSGVSFAKLWQLGQGNNCNINAGGHVVARVDFDSSSSMDPSDPSSY